MATVLGSWKEIANYLGKGVRTVQRWERQWALPVHRPSGADKGIVLAYPSELDAWAHRAPTDDIAGLEQSTGSADVQSRQKQLQRAIVLSSDLMRQSAMLRDHAARLIKQMERQNWEGKP